MQTTANISQPYQMIVNVESASMLNDLKKAIGMMRGVVKVTVPRKSRMSSYELSMRDIDEGRVNSYASVDDFFAKRIAE